MIGLRGAFRFNENSELSIDFENIGDKSYRQPSWALMALGGASLSAINIASEAKEGDKSSRSLIWK
jgi:hypothetical protein